MRTTSDPLFLKKNISHYLPMNVTGSFLRPAIFLKIVTNNTVQHMGSETVCTKIQEICQGGFYDFLTRRIQNYSARYVYIQCMYARIRIKEGYTFSCRLHWLLPPSPTPKFANKRLPLCLAIEKQQGPTLKEKVFWKA